MSKPSGFGYSHLKFDTFRRGRAARAGYFEQEAGQFEEYLEISERRFIFYKFAGFLGGIVHSN
jgi:hypothetical protein